MLVLVTALLATPANTRTFESIDGLLTVTSLFKSRSTSSTVKLKIMEFLYFYLMPETPTIPGGGANGKVMGLDRSSSQLMTAFNNSQHRKPTSPRDRRMSDPTEETRSTEEKQALLGRYLSNVEDLVQDLRDSAPFSDGIGKAC